MLDKIGIKKFLLGFTNYSEKVAANIVNKVTV